MAAEEQIGLQTPVELRAAHEIPRREAVAVLVVEHGVRSLVGLLVARDEDPLAVDVEADRRGVARVSRQRVDGQSVLLPCERLLEWQHAIDGNAKGLVLSTGVTNKAAQTLYESCGWKRDDEFFQYYLFF